MAYLLAKNYDNRESIKNTLFYIQHFFKFKINIQKRNHNIDQTRANQLIRNQNWIKQEQVKQQETKI